MRQTVHCGEYHTETVEQGHTYAELVILCESHILTREVTVIRNTVVRQHHTLGESCSTTGVLHIAHIMAVNILLHLVEGIIVDILT